MKIKTQDGTAKTADHDYQGFSNYQVYFSVNTSMLTQTVTVMVYGDPAVHPQG